MNGLNLVHIIVSKVLCIATLNKTHVIWQGSEDQVSNESERQWWSFLLKFVALHF